MSAEMKQVLEDLNKDWETFKAENDTRLDKIENGAGVADLTAKVDRINDGLDAAQKAADAAAVEEKALKDRIEAIEAAASNAGTSVNEEEARQAKCKDVFVKLVRSRFLDQELIAELKELRSKDVLIGVAASGGYALPEEISRDIDRQVKLISPVRNLVKVVQTSTNDYKELVDLNGAASGWVAETGTRSETGTSTLGERAPTMGELYAYPETSEWALDDLFFNVPGWISETVAESFAAAEGLAVVSGNGTNKPTGILNGTPVATNDNASPLRSVEVIEYHDNPSSPSALAATGIIDLVYTLKAGYRMGAAFAMNTNTQGAVRKLADTTGQYLWQPSLVLGQPSTLLGYPLHTWEDLGNVGIGTFPILFGNFRRGYVMADRVGTRMLTDPYTHPGYIRFYVRKRVGGIILNNEAIKALRT